MSDLYTVQFISPSDNSQTCFCYFNDDELRRRIKSCRTSCCSLKINFGEKFSQECYVSFHPQPRSDVNDSSIGISHRFAQKLGLKENQPILASNCTSNSSLNAVHVSPKDEESYEILTSHRNFLELNILNQVRIVFKNQILPIWIFSNVFIDLTIEKLVPDIRYGQLEQFTELIIIKPEENTHRNQSSNTSQLLKTDNSPKTPLDRFTDKIFSQVNELFSKKKSEPTKVTDQMQYISELIKNHERSVVYRILPSSALEESNIPEAIRNKFIFTHCFPYCEKGIGPCYSKIFAKIRKVKERTELKPKPKKEPKEEEKTSNEELCSYIISLNDKDDKILYCPSYVFNELRLQWNCRVLVNRETKMQPVEYKIESAEDTTENIIEDKSFFWSSLEKIRKSVCRVISDNVKFNHTINNLIIGSDGSGKTFLVNSIMNEFNRKYVHSIKIDCKTLRGKKVETLENLFTSKLSECAYRQPSLLVFDDLDALTYIDEEGGEYNKFYSDRICRMVTYVVKSFQKNNIITIIATARKISQLGALSTIRGPRLFENVQTIMEIQLEERNAIMKHLMSCRGFSTDESAYQHLSQNSNGYNIQDLVDVLDKAVIKCLLRNGSENSVILDKSDFDYALSETTPLSLHGVELHKEIPYKWSDVGGMENVKKILTEVFIWPSKYPQIFKSCPLRQQTGVLLYGAPGTGKTFVAGAIANECGMNFISIKGPELLSKYVGASEEAVRNLFIRAQKAQPCLLFFDEFDSLAPKRGHDNTGVTDRVVNQLLTQLDGVEVLEGVYLLAATSRPDLLDSALLRPGRLDRSVYCPLPEKDDRQSILQILSKDLRLGGDVDLSVIAEKSDGYTGADLQAVLYSAQMMPIKQIKDEDLDSVSADELIISQENLLQALSETKPSLSESEKLKYQKIYERFLSSRGSAFAEDFSSTQQKVTYA